MGQRATDDPQPVAPARQLPANRFGHVLVNCQPGGRNERGPTIGIGVEGPLVMTGDKPRDNDRLVRLETEVDVIEQDVQRHLVLQITAGHTDGDHRFSVAGDQRRCQRDPRPLSRLDAVGMSRCRIQRADPVSLGHARRAGLIADEIAAGGRRHDVAKPVGGQAGGRVLHGNRVGPARGDHRLQRRPSGQRVAGPTLKRCPDRVDQSASHPRISR